MSWIKKNAEVFKVDEQQDFTQEEIDNQIRETELRGLKVVEYLEKYKGQSIYNEIALAIEFGYQMSFGEIEEESERVFEKRKQMLLDAGMLFQDEFNDDCFWTDKSESYMFLACDVQAMDEFEFSELLVEVKEELQKL